MRTACARFPRRFATGVLLGLTSLVVSCGQKQEEITLSISAGAAGQDLDLTVAGVARFMEEHPNIRVLVVPTPRESDGRLAYYLKLLRESSSTVDVMQVDVVWIGAVAEHALDLREFIPAEELAQHLDLVIQNNEVDGRLVAVPWYSDMPSLYYRTDLLNKYGYSEPPKTWDELGEMAWRIQQGERIGGNLGFWGYAWQGAPYEGLTCNALEWQLSFGGGNFIGPDGRPNLANEGAIRAFRSAASWVGRISPPAVLNFDEDESRLLFQRGDAAFLRNWAYAYSVLREAGDVGKNFSVAPLPGGPGGRAAALGGWNLMVSRYSRYPGEAAELARYLTGRGEQKIRALVGSYLPTLVPLYEDPEVLQAAPLFEEFKQSYAHLVRRPSTELGEKYPAVSAVYNRAVHDILSGADPAERLKAAEAEMASGLAQ